MTIEIPDNAVDIDEALVPQIWNSMTDAQKTLCYYLIGRMVEAAKAEQ